jgi:uncharacterized membrane protein YqjE
MDFDAPSSSGLLGSLRGFADGLVGSVRDRVELITIELQEEKHRLIQLAIWLSALVALALLAIIFVSIALLVVFWETARVPVAIGLAAVYLLGFAAVAIGFKRYLARQPKPFAGTLAELREDHTCIREEN